MLVKAGALLRQRGFPGLAVAVSRKLFDGFRRLWRRVFRHRNHVFVWRGDPAGRPRLTDLTVLRFQGQDELPGDLRAKMAAIHSERIFETDRFEMEHGAVLWVVLMDGGYVGSSLSRSGRHYLKWFVELEPHDVVIFRNATAPAFRGRGICPALMREIIARELSDGGRAYVDCQIDNKASIRSIEKAGFRRIATLKPISLSCQFRFHGPAPRGMK